MIASEAGKGKAMARSIRVGIAGWVYAPWRGEFYPAGLPQKQELAYASARLGALEINATFRTNQAPKSFLKWREESAPDFVFSLKGPQFVTHIRRLQDVEAPLANFFASGVLALGQKLGPIVWQLPPNLPFEAARIADFLALLPKTPEAAAALGNKHDERLKTEPYRATEGIARIRHAIEVRHESYANPEFLALLRAHNVALVTADTAEWPYLDATADFAYGRLQGAPGADHYTEADLDRWAGRARFLRDGVALAEGPHVGRASDSPGARDVFLFFVSTDKVHAPRNAMALMQRLGIARAGA
jgi:uncharacterized protein YecE (DUF72 family)